MNVRKGAPRTNWTVIQEQTTEAARRGADAVIFPELCEAGAAYDKVSQIASTLGSGLFAQLVALSRQHNIHFMGSLFEKRAVNYHNSLVVISPRGGMMGVYRKMHLFSPMGEDKWLQPGESPLAINMPWGGTGFAICYDLRFPELFRRYVRDDVQMIVIPAAWPHPRLAHYRTLLRARAIENQCYVVAVNQVGQKDDGTHFFGHSCVIDPWGDIVVEAGETEAHLTVTLDMDVVSSVRRELPVLQDMRF
ncbi:MAG: carbon-nitrogen family hydrolase [Anaerolineae bacterium]|nr:carbon-nitrogen family hydrolase [Anaerolineae bacterium]